MVAISFEVPEKEKRNYEELVSFFINDVDLPTLKKIKNDFLFSKKLYADYQRDPSGQELDFKVHANCNDQELRATLEERLWS